MTRDIDARARVPVFPPRSARPGILLDDCERQPGLRQSDARLNAGHPCPDHDHMGVGLQSIVDLPAPSNRAAVDAIEAEIKEEEFL